MRCIIDGHCDTLSKALDTNTNLNNSKFCFYLDIVKDNVPYIQLMAAYVDLRRHYPHKCRYRCHLRPFTYDKGQS